MTTRRSLLRMAGALGAASLTAPLAACERPGTSRTGTVQPGQPITTDLLFVTTNTGLAVISAASGKATQPLGPGSLATADWRRLVTAEPDGAGVRLVTRDSRTGQIISGGTLRDRLAPRIVSPDGRLVALATPPTGGEAVTASVYHPSGRERTTIVVADSGGERVRIDMAGNLEPEAFSPDGSILYVLDYLPPAKPDRYRVRGIELATKKISPLNTRDKKPIPPGAEESMRGEGRQAVYDATRQTLFTLYTHQPEHEHTRDLLAGGARPDAPHVHAFVHALNLEQFWAYCIDLPAPFGSGPAAGHAITLGSGGVLYVADAGSGRLAKIDPAGLNILGVTTFSDPGFAGDAALLSTSDGGLVVGAGTKVVSFPLDPTSATPKFELATRSPVRGLALRGQDLFVGQDGAVATHRLGTAAETARIQVPGLVRLRHLTPAA